MTREANTVLKQALIDISLHVVADIRKQKTIAADYAAKMNSPENDRRQNNAN